MSQDNQGRGDTPLVEGVDFEIDALGRYVFTAHFLKQRGFCCFLACRHCPWGQAGRRPAEAEADRRQRLAQLRERLAAQGIRPDRLDYVNGVLRVSMGTEGERRGKSTQGDDRQALVQQLAEDLFPLLRVQAD